MKTFTFMAILICGIASAAPEPQWRIEKASAVAWSSILCNDDQNLEQGAQEWLGSKDLMILCIRTTLRIQWTQEYMQLRVEKENIKFVDQAGNTHKFGGKLLPANDFGWSWSELKAGGKIDQHSKSSPTYNYLPIFVVPRTVTSGTLHLGKHTVKVAVPRPKGTPSPASTISYKIVSAKMMAEIPTKTRSGNDELSGTLRNPFGSFLRVEYQLQPKQYFNPDESYNFDTDHFTIMTDKGVVAPTCGVDFMGDVKTTSHNVSRNSTVSTKAMYFAVPKTLKSFRVLYHNQPVTQPFAKIAR